ncbi:hypothetical protein NTE28_003578 [Vibrio harveyi]|nr:hypothetical protein [Vibrio harveyi]
MARDSRAKVMVHTAQIGDLMAMYPHCKTLNQAMNEHLNKTIVRAPKSAEDNNAPAKAAKSTGQHNYENSNRRIANKH